MKATTLLAGVLLGAGLFAIPLSGGETTKYPTFGKIERLDPAFDKLIPKTAVMEKLAELSTDAEYLKRHAIANIPVARILEGGIIWTEGPVWVKDRLLFSEIPNNVINQWVPGKGVSTYLKPAGYTGDKPRTPPEGGEPGSNGLTLDPQGRLTRCEHGDRRVTRVEKDGKITVLADKYEGKRLNSPNDLVFKSNGDLYFTDPPYGMIKNWDDPARELDFCGVYRLSKDGKLTLLTKEMTRPNGIAFSPDEKTLYVANSDPKVAIWKSFEVKADGTLGAGKVFFDSTKWVPAKKGLPDGLKVDVKGNLFATGPGGLLVFAPDGKHLGTLDTGVNTSNCAFGNAGTMLYITVNTGIARIQTSTKGLGF